MFGIGGCEEVESSIYWAQRREKLDAKTYLIKQLLLTSYLSEIMFSFRYTSSVNIIKKTMLSYRMGQKMNSQILAHIFTKYWWILQIFIYISQGSVATQLKGVVVYFVTALFQIIQRMCQWKIVIIDQYLGKMWTQICGLLFGANLYIYISVLNIRDKTRVGLTIKPL